jgi:hypothetical protein
MEVRILLPEFAGECMNRIENNFGEQVYVTAAYPEGLTLEQFSSLSDQQRRKHTWRPAVRGWSEATMRDAASLEPKGRAGD